MSFRSSAGGSTLPAYRRIADALRSSIESGELPVGTRLPSETALAVDLGVGRSTVREGLRVLQQAGYIERSSPRIFVVSSATQNPYGEESLSSMRGRNVTISALIEALGIIEPDLAALAARRRNGKDLAALGSNLDSQRLLTGDPAAYCELSEDFHVAVAEIADNAPLYLTRLTLGRLFLPALRAYVTSSDGVSEAIGFHTRLFEAISDGDAELAALVTRRQLEGFAKGWDGAGLDLDLDVSELVDEASARLHG